MESVCIQRNSFCNATGLGIIGRVNLQDSSSCFQGLHDVCRPHAAQQRQILKVCKGCSSMCPGLHRQLSLHKIRILAEKHLGSCGPPSDFKMALMN